MGIRGIVLVHPFEGRLESKQKTQIVTQYSIPILYLLIRTVPEDSQIHMNFSLSTFLKLFLF